MPKGRIGLSLDEDVLVILNDYGRSEKVQVSQCCGIWQPVERTTCVKCGAPPVADQRPTRTQIVEQGVRMWAEAKAGAGISGRYMKPLSEGNGGLPER